MNIRRQPTKYLKLIRYAIAITLLFIALIPSGSRAMIGTEGDTSTSGNGPASGTADKVTLFTNLVTQIGQAGYLDPASPNTLSDLNRIISENTSFGGTGIEVEPSEMANWLVNPNSLPGFRDTLGRLPIAIKNLNAILDKKINNMDETALADAKNQFSAAFALLDSYTPKRGTDSARPSGDSSCPSGQHKDSSGKCVPNTPTGGGGEDNATPDGQSKCEDSPSVTQSGGTYSRYTTGQLAGSKDVFNINMYEYVGLAHLEGSETSGRAAPPVNEVGPLLILTGQIKKLNDQICERIKEVADNIKAMQDDVKKIKVAAESIDVTTKAIKEDTDKLVKKEYELDPAARQAAAKVIQDEKRKFGNFIKQGRITGDINLEVDGSKTPVKDTFTPDINKYEHDARANAALVFYTELEQVLKDQNNTEATNNQAMVNFLLAKFKDQATDEASNNIKKMELVTKTSTPYDAYLYLNNLYQQAVNRAGNNAVSEYVAGNTIVGNKLCPGGYANMIEVTLTDGTKKKTCKDPLRVATPAPVIGSMINEFATANLRQLEMADEYKEDTVKIGEESGEPIDLKADVSDLTRSLERGYFGNLGFTPPSSTNTAPSPSPTPTPAPSIGEITPTPAEPNRPIPTSIPPAGPTSINTKPNKTTSANLASLGSLTPKKTPTIEPNIIFGSAPEIMNGTKRSMIALTTNNARVCVATSDWLTFESDDNGKSQLSQSSIFKKGDALLVEEINKGQKFTINHPKIFNLSSSIFVPEGSSINHKLPVEQMGIQSALSIDASGLKQISVYSPNLTNVEVGDIITIDINGTKIATEIIGRSASDIIDRLIIEATYGTLQTKKALADYSISRNGNMLVVATKNPVKVSIPKTATYSLECNINNKVESRSINIVFP